MLAAYLTLVELHCLHLVPVPALPTTPALPPPLTSRRILLLPGQEYRVPDLEQEGADDEGVSAIAYEDQYHVDREEDFENGRDDEDWLWEDEELCEEDCEFQWEYFTAKDVEDSSTKEEVVVDEASDGKEEVLNENDKLMIFTTGTKTYQAHQIGIKLMSKVKFRKKLNIPENIFKYTREAKQSREAERESLQGRIDFEPTPWSDYKEVAQMFDIVDVLIDFQGYVTGYGVSPDARSVTKH